MQQDTFLVRPMRMCGLFVATILALAAHGSAQDGLTATATAPAPATTEPKDSSQTVTPEDHYEFHFNAGAWLPRLGGKVTFGPSAAANEISLEDSFNLDSSEAVGLFELGMRKNDAWGLNLSGFHFSTSSSGPFVGHEQFGSLTLNDGDRFNSSFDMTSIEGEFAYWPASWRPATHGVKGSEVDLWFAHFLALRYLDVHQRVELSGGGTGGAGGGRESAGGDWLTPMVGLQLHLHWYPPAGVPLLKGLEIGGAVALGPALGSDGGFITQISAGITAFFTNQIGLSFGYRLLEAHVEKDDYKFTGGLQGLFLAGTVHF